MSDQSTRQRKLKGKKGERRPDTEPSGDDGKTQQKDGHSCVITIVKIIPAVIFCIILVLVALPAPIEPQQFSVAEAPALEGALAPNDILTKAERFYENEVLGPESIVIRGDHLYTGTADGKILDIYQGNIRVLARLGKQPCGSFEDEPICGRPLGMRFDNDGQLIVADAYLGLHKINVATGEVKVLWPHTAPIDGKLARFFNAVLVTRDGMVYFTDSSTKWDRRHNRYSIMEAETTGRLVAYDPVANTTTVVASGLSFPNGLELSKAGDFLIMAETTKSRIWKFHLSGRTKGELELFADNLPGLPDNIQKSSTGGFWVGLAGARWKGKFSFLDFAAPYPWLRKVISKVIPQELIIKMVPKYGLAVELDQSGTIIRSVHDPTGERVPTACDVADRDGVLYLGSYYLPYMSKVDLKELTKKP